MVCMSATVVTALYDIGRDKFDADRTMEDYLHWFGKTLALNVPMVIFTQEKYKDFITQHRDAHDTKIIVMPLQETPYYKYKDKMDHVLESAHYRTKMQDTNRIECKMSLYSILQYSKFEWLNVAAQQDHFNTPYFFWLDAGGSRFFQDLDPSKPWPSNYKLLNSNKFNIQGNYNTVRWVREKLPYDMYENNCILVGGLFGGTKEICIKTAQLVNNAFDHYLEQGVFNNEQILLGTLLLQDHKPFNVYIELDGTPLPFLRSLGQHAQDKE